MGSWYIVPTNHMSRSRRCQTPHSAHSYQTSLSNTTKNLVCQRVERGNFAFLVVTAKVLAWTSVCEEASRKGETHVFELECQKIRLQPIPKTVYY